MKLAVSNIAWPVEKSGEAYALMAKLGFTGLEIAPTSLFPQEPYSHIQEARRWREGLGQEHGFVVPSMQSIWYGRPEKLFGTEGERQALLGYTKAAIDFAAAIGCKNLVFGCPRNRSLPDGADPAPVVAFFKELGDYAKEKGACIGLEANPPIYNTNFINTTRQALELIEAVGSPGFLLNLDVGTMVENGESPEMLEGKVGLISHVHISEPGLPPIEPRPLHKTLRQVLEAGGYKGFVSIEMNKEGGLPAVEGAMAYVGRIFHG